MNAQPNSNSISIAVVGAGPAGLHAAEVISRTRQDCRVVIFDARRYAGRKFLVAGKSGLNLTNAEAFEPFVDKFSGPPERWRKILADFDNQAVRKWAADLGFETFVSSGGKVFPEPMKSGPLLRTWMLQLQDRDNIEFRFSRRITAMRKDGDRGIELVVDNETTTQWNAVIFATGGASWPKTGSDGAWVDVFKSNQVDCSCFQSANCGWNVDWPAEIIEGFEGTPLKNVTVHVGEHNYSGELMITRYGLEGGPIYHLGPILRAMDRPAISIDFKPTMDLKVVEAKLGSISKNFTRQARRRLRLCDGATAILRLMPNVGPWTQVSQLALGVKNCPISLTGPQPIEEAISTAGGIAWHELDEHLMVRKLPGVFVSGEMIDWEAPTGGYLITGCLATAQMAAAHALRYIAE